MATSTETTVRQVIVDALRGVSSDLGFDETQGNIKDYLLEYEEPTLWANYLRASVGGKQVVRCVAAEVMASENWYGMGNKLKRTYQIAVVLYFAKGVRGEGINALIEAARVARGAIHQLNQTLSNTVDFASGATVLDVSEQGEIDSIPGSILVGRMEYVAEKVAPDF